MGTRMTRVWKSLPFSAEQQREMTRFMALWSAWTHLTHEGSNVVPIYNNPEIVTIPVIWILNDVSVGVTVTLCLNHNWVVASRSDFSRALFRKCHSSEFSTGVQESLWSLFITYELARIVSAMYRLLSNKNYWLENTFIVSCAQTKRQFLLWRKATKSESKWVGRLLKFSVPAGADDTVNTLVKTSFILLHGLGTSLLLIIVWPLSN